MKKVLGIILSTLMLFSMFTANVFAKTGDKLKEPVTFTIGARDGSIHKIDDPTVELTEMTFDTDMQISEITIPDGYEAVRNLFTFDGFEVENKKKDGYIDSTSISTVVEQELGNILYVKWKGVGNITVTFDPNGGSLSATTYKYVTTGAKYGDLPTPTRFGYSFAGWHTEDGSKDDTIKSDTTVTVTENQTLYAHWSLNTYRVAYSNANPIDPENDPFTPTEYNVETYIEGQEPKERKLPTADKVEPREGFEFAGWFYKQETEPTLYIPNLATKIQYSAHWKPINGDSVTFNEHNESNVVEGISITNTSVEDVKSLFGSVDLNNIKKGYEELGRKLIFDIYVSDGDAEGVKSEIAKDIKSEDVKCVAFDINLKVGFEELMGPFKQVNNTGAPVKFNVILSADEAEGIYGSNKNYFVMREHYNSDPEADGFEYTSIPASLVNNGDDTFTLSFSSDKFSTFALYSIDKPAPTPVVDDKPVKSYVAPKTGIQ